MDTAKMETLELAVKEVCEGQLKTNELISDLITAVNNNRNDVKQVNQKLDDQKIALSQEDKKYLNELFNIKFSDQAFRIDGRLEKMKPQKLQALLETITKDGFVKLFLGALFLTYFFLFSWHHWK